MWLEHSGAAGIQLLEEVRRAIIITPLTYFAVLECMFLPAIFLSISIIIFVCPHQVKAQAALAWLFIIDRRIEAPERFHAIQTHRVTLAVLTQQALFVEELAEDGILDEAEEEKLSHAILRQRQR